MNRSVIAVLLGAALATAPPNAHAQGRGKVSLDTVQFAPVLEVDLAASKRVANGLYVRDFVNGNGRLATRGDEVTVRYVGRLADGRAFTEPAEPPATFKLGAGIVIEGWDRGLSGMRVGGRRQLVIAPDLGYRNKQTGAIPPNSVLVFEVELVSVR
jgi:FKBP-type peptidyl-prolyl cis-trans isomerase FkpA